MRPISLLLTLGVVAGVALFASSFKPSEPVVPPVPPPPPVPDVPPAPPPIPQPDAPPAPAIDMPPPEKKGYSLGPACGDLTIYDGATGLAWAFDEARFAKTQAAAFARIFEGCGESSLYPLIKTKDTAGYMYLLGRATYKGLVAGGILDKPTAQAQVNNWRQLALAAGVAPELLPEDV